MLYALPTVEETPESLTPLASPKPGGGWSGEGGSPEPRPSASILVSGSVSHPLSINPPQTWVGLACFAGLGLMLLGLARGIGGRDLRLLAPGIVALGVLMSMTGMVQKALWSGKVYGYWEPVNKGVVAFVSGDN